MVPQFNMLLCPCVCGLQQYGHLNNAAHYASCLVLFSNSKEKIVKIDVTAVFNKAS